MQTTSNISSNKKKPYIFFNFGFYQFAPHHWGKCRNLSTWVAPWWQPMTTGQRSSPIFRRTGRAGLVWILSWGGRTRILGCRGIFTLRSSCPSYCLGWRHGWWTPHIKRILGGSTKGCCSRCWGRCIDGGQRGSGSNLLWGMRWGLRSSRILKRISPGGRTRWGIT